MHSICIHSTTSTISETSVTSVLVGKRPSRKLFGNGKVGIMVQPKRIVFFLRQNGNLIDAITYAYHHRILLKENAAAGVTIYFKSLNSSVDAETLGRAVAYSIERSWSRVK